MHGEDKTHDVFIKLGKIYRLSTEKRDNFLSQHFFVSLLHEVFVIPCCLVLRVFLMKKPVEIFLIQSGNKTIFQEFVFFVVYCTTFLGKMETLTFLLVRSGFKLKCRFLSR